MGLGTHPEPGIPSRRAGAVQTPSPTHLRHRHTPGKVTVQAASYCRHTMIPSGPKLASVHIPHMTIQLFGFVGWFWPAIGKAQTTQHTLPASTCTNVPLHCQHGNPLDYGPPWISFDMLTDVAGFWCAMKHPPAESHMFEVASPTTLEIDSYPMSSHDRLSYQGS